ncbi:MAG: radical SAM protein [Thermoplasmata archaeon]|nr:radical SAM protein [Thermoplasmata archaeon]
MRMKQEYFDPFKVAEKLRAIVCKSTARKYYRFRGGKFYGGIASADCVGCILECAFCWSNKPRRNPEKLGKFYEPSEVADKLIKLARKNNYTKVRITGNEPTLCQDHLLEVISQVPGDLLFMLETNGILIDEEYAKKLSQFNNLHVRVSLKASNETQFAKITNAGGEYFRLQFDALENLIKNNVSCHPAIMENLILSENDLMKLRNRLATIKSSLGRELEFEPLILYPFIKLELENRDLKAQLKI